MSCYQYTLFYLLSNQSTLFNVLLNAMHRGNKYHFESLGIYLSSIQNYTTTRRARIRPITTKAFSRLFLLILLNFISVAVNICDRYCYEYNTLFSKNVCVLLWNPIFYFDYIQNTLLVFVPIFFQNATVDQKTCVLCTILLQTLQHCEFNIKYMHF